MACTPSAEPAKSLGGLVLPVIYAIRVDSELSLGLVEHHHAPIVRELWHRNAERLAANEPWAARVGGLEDPTPWIRHCAELTAAGSGWFNLLLLNNMPVGTCLLMINQQERTGSIGYMVDHSHEGRGLVTRAARWLTWRAFSRDLVDRLEIGAAVDNQRSRAVPERLGYSFEGITRGGLRFPDRRADRAIYSLMAADALR